MNEKQLKNAVNTLTKSFLKLHNVLNNKKINFLTLSRSSFCEEVISTCWLAFFKLLTWIFFQTKELKGIEKVLELIKWISGRKWYRWIELKQDYIRFRIKQNDMRDLQAEFVNYEFVYLFYNLATIDCC